MTRLVVVLALVACAPHTANLPGPAPAPAVVAPPPPPTAPTLDEAAVKAKSHDFFDAIDRFDNATFAAMVTPSFVMFQNARYLDAAFIQKGAQARLDQHAPVRSRTWSDERVYRGATSVVFIGHAIQRVPGDGGQPAVERDGYHTLVWVPDGATWKVAFAEWVRGGLDAEKEDWNETFKLSNNFKKEPNQLLIDTVKGIKPGSALDVGMGQGRNAIYLASQGWKVTGVDISDEGIKIAKDEAAKRKLKLDAIQADVHAWDPGKDKWDLVTMIYAGDEATLVERLKPAIKKGGLFVLEYFHAQPETEKFGAGGWPSGALKVLFGDGYDILRDDEVEDIADWSLTKRKLVRFVARKK
jgi:SAM-dependent methyltransferase